MNIVGTRKLFGDDNAKLALVSNHFVRMTAGMHRW